MAERALRKNGRAQRSNGVAQRVCGRCCGGGGGNCCVCGLCKPTNADTMDKVATMGLTGGGEDSGCCVAQRPIADGCAVSILSVVNPTVLLDTMPLSSRGDSGCWISGGAADRGTFEQDDCGGSPSEFDYTDSLGVSVNFAEGEFCPQFVVPGSGAIVAARSLQDGTLVPAVTVWGGSRCSGPLAMASMIRTLRLEPSGVLATIYIFAVVGAGGGAAYIARVGPWCPGWPVVDGCVWLGGACGVKPGPLKVNGGGNAGGQFDCDTGSVSLSGSINASYTSACDYEYDNGGPCSSVDPPCVGLRPLATGPFSVSFGYDVAFDLAGLIEPCDGNRPDGDSGRDSDSGVDDDDALPLQLVVPESFLETSPVLRESYDDIRKWLKPSVTPTPPPGGLDPNIANILDQQARGGGCRGCGDGFSG